MAVAGLAEPHRAGAAAQAARQRRAALGEGDEEAAALGLQLGQVAGQPRVPQLLRQLLRLAQRLQRQGPARPPDGGGAEGERQDRRQQQQREAAQRRHGGRAEEAEAPRRQTARLRHGAPPVIGGGGERGRGRGRERAGPRRAWRAGGGADNGVGSWRVVAVGRPRVRVWAGGCSARGGVYLPRGAPWGVRFRCHLFRAGNNAFLVRKRGLESSRRAGSDCETC